MERDGSVSGGEGEAQIQDDQASNLPDEDGSSAPENVGVAATPVEEGASEGQPDPETNITASPSPEEADGAAITSGVMERDGSVIEGEDEAQIQDDQASNLPDEDGSSAPENVGVAVTPVEEGASEGQPDPETNFTASPSPEEADGAAITSELNVDEEPSQSYFNSPENMEVQEPLAEEEELVVLDPEHPLVRCFQTALKNRLNKQLERINNGLREKKAMEQAEASRNYEICQEVYRIQENLARVQSSLEQHHENATQAAAERRQVQDELEAMRSQYRNAVSQVTMERSHESQLRAEMDNLALRLLYTRDTDMGLTSDVKAMKNTVRKAQTEKTQTEDNKHKQDLYVERLTKELERLTEQVAMYDDQTVIHKREAGAAKEALSEAQMEMESLAIERKQLLQQWNSTLLGMRKRDEAFSFMQDTLSAAKHQLPLLDGEVAVLQKHITAEEDQHETLTMQLNRVELSANTSRKLASQSRAQHEALQAQCSAYARTLQETKHTYAQLNMEKRELETEMNKLLNQLNKVNGVRLDLEGKIMTQMQEELTQDKAAKYYQRLATKMATLKKQKIAQGQAQLVKLENSIAALNQESSEVLQSLDSLAMAQEALEQEIAERDKLLAVIKANITSEAHIIDRKGVTILNLNREIRNIEDATGTSGLSPQQILLASLTKQTEELEAEMQQQRQLWMWQQNILVGLTQERQTHRELTLKLEAQFTVLQQTKLRMESEIEAVHREQNELQRHMKMFGGDLQKLSGLLNKNGHLQQALEQENMLMHSDFLHRLKDAQRELVEMQMKLEKALEDKERILNFLVEAQRQVMLWETKIQLAKETRSAVDSEAGQGEIRLMKAEIHRMEVRYNQLMKQQERLVRESEATVSRRENIDLRREAQARGDRKPTTHSTLQLSVRGLRRNIQDTHKQVAESEQVIQTLQESQLSLSANLSQKKHFLTELHGVSSAMASELSELQDTRDRNLALLVALQSRCKQLQAVREGRYTALSSQETLEPSLQSQRERVHAVSAIVHRICQEFPHYQGELRRLALDLAAHTQEKEQSV